MKTKKEKGLEKFEIVFTPQDIERKFNFQINEKVWIVDPFIEVDKEGIEKEYELWKPGIVVSYRTAGLVSVITRYGLNEVDHDALRKLDEIEDQNILVRYVKGYKISI